MKKLVSVLLAAGLLASVALFAGCNDGVKIEGDFSKEATAEEVTQLAETIAANTGWFEEEAGYGWTLSADQDMSVRYVSGEESMSVKGTAELDLGIVTLPQQAMSGKVKMEVKAEGTEVGGAADMAVDGSVYLGTDGLYIDGSVKMTEGANVTEKNGKYVYPSSLLSSLGIGSMIPTPGEFVEGLSGVLETESIKVYIDDSGDEIKVKVSADIPALMEDLADGVLGEVPEIVQIVEALESDACDVYFSFRKEGGLLTGYGYVVDMSIPETTVEGEGQAVTLSCDYDQSFWFLYEEVTIEVPEDLASYQPASDEPSVDVVG